MAISPIDLFIDHIPSPIGTILLACDKAGLVRALDFEDYESRMHRLLSLHYSNGYTLIDRAAPTSTLALLKKFFAGYLGAINQIEVETGGTAFQRQVWKALRTIPGGTTTTYGQLAAGIGRRTASRAVGAANGANPIAIIVPCHRVIGSNGDLTGYGGGMERKRWLLQHEMKWTAPEAQQKALNKE